MKMAEKKRKHINVTMEMKLVLKGLDKRENVNKIVIDLRIE